MPFLLLMPSYNQAHFIAEAVRSILAQDDPDWELWIVDNSTDDTPKVMRRFTDSRIRFHHVPTRMDPGSCLNWMLQRAQGRDFSYVHTDNNLHPGYVGRMRAALAGDALCLAYCDMKIIDQSGRRTAVSRRGAFDLPRLLSMGPLGVPFAATTELAARLGGFSAGDVADDVRFCAQAYGMARFVYLPQPLIDYRLHETSRTAGNGDMRSVRAAFLRAFEGLVPQLQARGVRPLEALAEAIRQKFQDLDCLVEDLWYRKFARHLTAWFEGDACVEPFARVGLLQLPGWYGQALPPLLGRWGGRWHAPWTTLRLLFHFRRLRRDFRQARIYLRDRLVPWAWLSCKMPRDPGLRFRITSCDIRTIWGAWILHKELGWQPAIDPGCKDVPSWLRWPHANGDEPRLDLHAQPQFGIT